ncbi:MAG: hypothetical protein J6C28_03040 [Bacilli bacterium]|nr:hypothetical protein [Bacilli bacterium]
MEENRKPKVSWFDECLQVSLLKLAQISIMQDLTIPQVKAYFDEIINDLYQMEELMKKEKEKDEKQSLS